MAPFPAAGGPPPPLQSRVGFTIRPTPQYPLAAGTVPYVGEPVAIGGGEDRHLAEDALAPLGVRIPSSSSMFQGRSFR